MSKCTCWDNKACESCVQLAKSMWLAGRKQKPFDGLNASEAEALREKLRRAELARDSYKHDLDVRCNQLDVAYAEITQLKTEVTSYRDDIKMYRSDAEHWRTQCQKVTASYEDARQQIEDLKQDGDNWRHRYQVEQSDSIDALEHDHQQLLKNYDDVVKERDTLRQDVGDLSRDIAVLTQERDAWQKGVAVDERLIRIWKRRHSRLLKAAIRYRANIRNAYEEAAHFRELCEVWDGALKESAKLLTRATELRASAEAQTNSLIHENERLRSEIFLKHRGLMWWDSKIAELQAENERLRDECKQYLTTQRDLEDELAYQTYLLDGLRK